MKEILKQALSLLGKFQIEGWLKYDGKEMTHAKAEIRRMLIDLDWEAGSSWWQLIRTVQHVENLISRTVCIDESERPHQITPDDERLMELAVENRKFFCIVCTHADNLAKIVDKALQKQHLDELEGQLRKDLSLVQSLNVRIFIVCISFPEGQSTLSPDLESLSKNIRELQFPLLQAYLSQPRGLLDELQIHSFVKEEVSNALEPFVNVKKRHQALDFSQHLVAGTLLPIAGPVMVSFLKTIRYTLKACSEVGLIEDDDDAMNKVMAGVNKHGLSAKIASKEGMITAVHDSLIHIFGEVVFEIAIAEVVSTAAEAALHGALPLVGPAISAAHLPGRFKKIDEKLASKACMLHELWIMQNISGLLGKS
ncbi:hypothetical protein GOP47_0001803 [Adiantum capillus-veneris]|uniref:Uncharacterized protein n=1 Tax=Adiantum capillus-veneris TaxID=13818 RepID=A0A9D4ZR15_ADICA|nr:hypothetical protein GOP47_0001803 [Adiantum capillus-veneris]